MTPLPSTGSANPLDTLPMRRAQVVAVAVTVLLNALDGFDVLSISFASPGIAADWGISRATLGVVLSMELIGMAIGSLLLGRAGDRHGRRPVTLACLVLMTAGMLLASRSDGIAMLIAARILTGTGIGGMLAVTAALASELSNLRYRSMAVSIMVIGYPFGAVLGGSVVAQLLKVADWPIVFQFGGAITAAMIPLVLLVMPETPAFLAGARQGRSLDTLNRSLVRLGHAALDRLPDLPTAHAPVGIAALLRPDMRATTLRLTLACFAQMITFYFIVKWTPKIVTDLGFDASRAAGVLVWANVGGALGGALWGYAATRTDLKRLSLATFAASSAMVMLFGALGNSLFSLSLLAATGGFCTNAAMVALYNLSAAGFPDRLRATGTGFVIGLGRGGAVIGPIMAGFLFEQGLGLGVVAAVMAVGSLVALAAIAGLPLARPGGRPS